MFDYFKKKFDELLASVFDPVVKKILALSWPKRLLVLIGIIAIIAFWKYADTVGQAGRFTVHAARILSANPNKIPLSEYIRTRGLEAQSRLLLANRNDTNLLATDSLTGWSASQTLFAITGRERLAADEQNLVRYIREKELTGCSCWAEFNNDDEVRAWTFISGWVLAALAEAGVAATESEIKFLLVNQKPDGSWSSRPGDSQTEYASTYTTAWAIIGLAQQLNLRQAPDLELIKRARDGVNRGAVWLLANRQNRARWKPYPNFLRSEVSESISGLAVYALHKASVQTQDIDSEWLDNIPASPIPASSAEKSYVEVRQGRTVLTDHFEQLTMPWMLMGTIDAYPKGTLAQKAKALSWIERTIEQDSVKNADTGKDSWWRAELLISLNYLLGKM